MNLEAKIFYVTIHFSPKYDREFELMQGDVYKHIVAQGTVLCAISV